MYSNADSSHSSPPTADASITQSLYGGPECDSIFSRSTSLWRARLHNAKSNCHTLENTVDLRTCLRRIPQLPKSISPKSKWIEGHSTWSNADSSCALRSREETPQRIFLSKLCPTTCTVSKTDNFRGWGKHANNGIGLLALGWAYILSAELAERQGLLMEYGVAHAASHDASILDLGYASSKERRWWKAIVSPGTGWSIAGGRVAPWAVAVEDIGIRVSEHVARSYPPPTAQEAARYLSRLCCAYDLGSQASAALAAALTIPLHSSTAPLGPAKIELPRPKLENRALLPHSSPPLVDFDSIGHYMMLSLCHRALGSSLWSVFWASRVPCNLAGAWTVPIATVLQPIIHEGNLELLAKVLSGHNMSPLWLGVMLCGRGPLINSILPSLTELRDYPYFRPSIDAAAWTGAAQSFFESPQTPLAHDRTVSRADVWRLRHDCSKEYDDETFLHTPSHGWYPFGRMKETDVELEIREHLVCSHEWEYSHWNWSVTELDPGRCTMSPRIEKAPEWNWTIATCNGSPDDRDRKVAYYVSEIATKEIFWWCCGQVERGFGGTIVPRLSGPDEVLESKDSCHHRRLDYINEWRRNVRKCLGPRDYEIYEWAARDSQRD